MFAVLRMNKYDELANPLPILNAGRFGVLLVTLALTKQNMFRG